MHKDIISGGTGTISGLVSTMHVKTQHTFNPDISKQLETSLNSTKKDAGAAGGDGVFNITSVDDEGSPEKPVEKKRIPKEPGSRHRYLQQ